MNVSKSPNILREKNIESRSSSTQGNRHSNACDKSQSSTPLSSSNVDMLVKGEGKAAVVCKSYTRSYIPSLEDGNSSESDGSDAESPHKASTVAKNFVYVSCIG